MTKTRLSLLAAAATIVALPATLAAQPYGHRHIEGGVTLADLEARSAEHFAKLDGDGDGLVTKSEMEAARAALRERHAERLERMGERAERRLERRAARHERRFARLDADNDGALSLAEFQAGPRAMFERADADDDGIVTEAERKAAREAMRERRKERRQQRGQ